MPEAMILDTGCWLLDSGLGYWNLLSSSIQHPVSILFWSD